MTVRKLLFIFVLLVLVVAGIACVEPNAAAVNGKTAQAEVEDPIDPDRPPTAKTLYLMADMLSAQGKDAEAEQLYRRILSQHSDFLPAYNDLASLMMRQRRIPEAMKVLEAGLKQNANDPVLLNNIGMCWLIRKQYQNALDYFTKASAVVPENTRYRSNMATVLALMGRRKEALALYRQILPEDEAQENMRILQENIKILK